MWLDSVEGFHHSIPQHRSTRVVTPPSSSGVGGVGVGGGVRLRPNRSSSRENYLTGMQRTLRRVAANTEQDSDVELGGGSAATNGASATPTRKGKQQQLQPPPQPLQLPTPAASSLPAAIQSQQPQWCYWTTAYELTQAGLVGTVTGGCVALFKLVRPCNFR